MFEEALKIWSELGIDAAVVFLNGQENQKETAETYHKLMKELYWQQKNVPDMVIVARAGIDYSLAAAETFDDYDPQLAYELRSWAKSIAYDLASFTWRGWDEPGMVIAAEDEVIGLQAAELNLRLAEELDKGALRVSRAYWALGAQQLAVGDFSGAENSFQAGEEKAQEASEESDARLCRAYLALAAYLQQPDDPVRRADLTEAKQALEGVEHGPYFIEQVETALGIFG